MDERVTAWISPPPLTPLNSAMRPSEDSLRTINNLSLRSGLLLMQHGAESALVENVARRVGLALGADKVDIAIMANALVVTTSIGPESKTLVGRNVDQGINMNLLIDVQRVMLDLEASAIDLDGAARRLNELSIFRYPRWMVAVAIGISCAAFARLANANAFDCAVTFVASTAAMAARQLLARLHFSPLVVFFAAAFVATSVAGQALVHGWGANPNTSMAASCLLLVPGVPLINSVSDMVKGYINTGISRGVFATLLAIATCGGIMLAMTVWKVWAWL
ncbi:MAG TPA: threonine/serine exporter family protein [Opitutaceae bacterium]|nr:threonine/serine exporter family protein [Opitutaceae bacterium]